MDKKEINRIGNTVSINNVVWRVAQKIFSCVTWNNSIFLSRGFSDIKALAIFNAIFAKEEKIFGRYGYRGVKFLL